MRAIGVFIGRDIEMVRTDRYEITFRRLRAGDAHLEAFWCGVSGGKASVGGVCRMGHYGTAAAYAMRALPGSDAELLRRIGGPPSYSETGDGVRQTLTFDDAAYDVCLAETIGISKGGQRRSLTDSSISECLCDWQKGTQLIRYGDAIHGLVINTNKHMCIFEVGDHGIYIRAARYACTDEGIVFAQNIQMRSGTFVQAAEMLDDNRDAAGELHVDASKFLRNACYMPPVISDGIYWSVKSYSVAREEIVLNGCQGQDYVYNRDGGQWEERIY